MKEKGAAGIVIELSDGIITVKHQEAGVVLVRWEATEGDWNRLWETINKLSGKEK